MLKSTEIRMAQSTGGERSWLRLAALVLAAMAGACSAPAPPPAPPANLQPVETTIGSGRLRGRSDGGVTFFKNIPFAAPPVGALRWRPPAAPAAWSGVRDASAYGNDCMQNRMSWDKAVSPQPLSEDCLYLNVWTPATLPAKPELPVMVWVYGGGDASGSANSPATEGDRLAARGAVVVSFNYRIGRFGFFAHPALTAESPDGLLGNYGFMDQVAALKWVQRNIRAFGGDPANVTIFGESAGGDAVLKLMLNPLARGLFAKVICESAGGNFLLPRLHEDLPDLPSAEKLGQAFAEDAGIQGEPLAALRALPAKKVLGGISLIEWEKKTWSGPMIDGRLVTSDVAAGFAAGRQAKVPLVIGSNSDELGAIPWIFRRSMVKDLYPRFKGHVDDVIAAYGGEDPFDDRILNDFVFNEPARYMAYHSSATQPAYLYRFSYVAESKRKDLKGAPHASETYYVFDHLEVTGEKVSDADRQMAQRLGDYWLAFARTGVPHVDGDPSWPAYSAVNDLLFDFTAAGETTAKADAPWLEAIARYVH